MSTTPNVTRRNNDVSPSEAVVEQVAASEGVDHTELVPLYRVIDTDALDKLVGTPSYADDGPQITFTYHGYFVTVTGDGGVHLTRAEDGDG